MKFTTGVNMGHGIPVYKGDVLVGWICTTLNKKYMISFVGKSDNKGEAVNTKFSSIEEAKTHLEGVYV